MTVGEFISDVKNSVKAITKDDRISSRYIHSLAKHYTSYLLSQRSLSDIFRDSSIYTDVPCVEMIQIRSDKCDIAEFRKCDKIMKSKCKLPELYNSSIGPVVVSVTNMTGDVEYQRLRTAADYKNQSKRKFSRNTKFYYLANGYLYVLNSTNERVSILGLFTDELEALRFSACNDTIGECEAVFGYKLIVPNKYISTIKDQVVEHILKTNKSVAEDELPNLDSNQKTKNNA